MVKKVQMLRPPSPFADFDVLLLSKVPRFISVSDSASTSIAQTAAPASPNARIEVLMIATCCECLTVCFYPLSATIFCSVNTHDGSRQIIVG